MIGQGGSMSKKSLFAAVVFFALSLPSVLRGQALDEKLILLKPMVGTTWEGTLKSPDGRQEFKTVQRLDAVWNGSVLRYTGSVPDLNDRFEGFVYWDPEANRIAFFIAHSKGVIKRGTVSGEDGIITFRGRILFPERQFDFRNTFEFPSEGIMIDRWFQNAFGPWQPGHVIEFKAKGDRPS
jgi:hypothetical protein